MARSADRAKKRGGRARVAVVPSVFGAGRISQSARSQLRIACPRLNYRLTLDVE